MTFEPRVSRHQVDVIALTAVDRANLVAVLPIEAEAVAQATLEPLPSVGDILPRNTAPQYGLHGLEGSLIGGQRCATLDAFGQ